MKFSPFNKVVVITFFVAVSGLIAHEDGKHKKQIEDAKLIPAAAPAVAPDAAPAKDAEQFKKDKETLSYGQGHRLGGDLLESIEFIDKELFIQGLKDALDAKENKISEDELRRAYERLEPLMREAYLKKQEIANKKQEEAKAALKATNAKMLEGFLKEALTKTGSGLEYKVVKQGEGVKALLTDNVTVHYTGYLVDGTVFDSSVVRGEPVSFPLGRVIKGWQEGVQLMNVGSKFMFKIPANLGYGDEGTGGIPPGSTLIFEIELISIQK